MGGRNEIEEYQNEAYGLWKVTLGQVLADEKHKDQTDLH